MAEGSSSSNWPLMDSPSRKTPSSPSSRLQTITEGNNRNAPAVPPRSSLRENGSTTSLPGRSAPPAYGWVPEAKPKPEPEDGRVPVEGEKLAELRRGGGHIRSRRGGWVRLGLIFGVLALIVIGLAVGLGVGLTVGKENNKKQQPDPGPSNPGTGPMNNTFPLGEYSMVTALKDVSTNCTSNSATWSCYPATVFDPSVPGSNTSSMATFNWIIQPTASDYATVSTGATSDAGIPANLTISSTNNPLSVSFTNQSLTYFASSSNSTSARYTFSFTTSKVVFPPVALTSDNAATKCFYNQTMFLATLYLAAPRDYPSSSLANSDGVGGFTQWPFALEITQTSPGGQDVPACYEYINGAVGKPISPGLAPEPSTKQCLCDYNNFH